MKMPFLWWNGTPRVAGCWPSTTRVLIRNSVWAGKKEHASFEVPTVSLHVHERIDPHTIIDAVRKRNGSVLQVQASLLERREENPPLREAIDFIALLTAARIA